MKIEALRFDRGVLNATSTRSHAAHLDLAAMACLAPFTNAVRTPPDRGTAMDIVKLARTSGLQILLDARIGRETYHSVSGSLSSLQRFADAVRAAIEDERAASLDAVEHGGV
jgi:hypothetical protein